MKRVRPFRLARRAALRGAGVCLALPWLEAMIARPARAQGSTGDTRALFVYFPSGYPKGSWVVEGRGDGFVLPGLARALEPWKHKLTIVTGLVNRPAAVGRSDAGGIHARGTGGSLVCQALRSDGFDGDGVSADQVIVQKLASQSCISSLVLGLPNERIPTFSEEGLNAIYYNNVSFAGPRSPVQKVRDPADLFLRMVTCPGLGGTPDAKRARFEQRVMDAVKRKAQRLMGCAGQADRLRLEEYFTSISELERRFLPAAVPAVAGSACRPPEPPPVAGSTLKDGAMAMMDLAVLAFSCGLSRVGTLMMDGAFSRRSYGLPGLGSANYIHGLSHGEIGGEERDTPRWRAITTHYFELFAHLLAKLDAVEEGGRSMLDNSVVYIGSEFGDGHAHDIADLPVIVAGGAAGRLRMGAHLPATGLPVANALLDVLVAMGVERTTFGDSTGRVPGLSA